MTEKTFRIPSIDGDQSTRSNWNVFGNKIPKEEFLFFAQVVLINIVCIACIINLSIGNGNSNLWTSLLSGSLGYILPSPKLCKHVAVLPDSPQYSSMEYYPENIVANFKTRVANPIPLEGDWDVALCEIQYKRMWYTINYEDTHITYQYKLPPIASFILGGPNKPREFALLIIPQGYYNTRRNSENS